MKTYKKMVVSLVVVAMCAAMSSTAFAQDGDDRVTALESGSHMLSFSAPFGGGGLFSGLDDFFGGGAGTAPTISYYMGVSDEFQLGGAVGFSYDDDVVLTLSPTAKFFFTTDQRVNPYGYGRVDIFHDGRAEGGDGETDIGLGAGIGVEFFMVPEVSLGARAGVELLDTTPDDISTFSSGFDLNFYF